MIRKNFLPAELCNISLVSATSALALCELSNIAPQFAVKISNNTACIAFCSLYETLAEC